MLEEHPAEVVMEKNKCLIPPDSDAAGKLILDLKSHGEVCPDFHFLPCLFLQSK